MQKKSVFIASLFLTFAGCSDSPTRVDYSLPAGEYKTRLVASDPAGWKPVNLTVTAPTGGITLADGGMFKTVLERNIEYLLGSFTVNHLLYPFRMRAGKPPLPDNRPQVGFWDTDLRGSNAGRYMMGAGNTLRWLEHAALRDSLNKLIDGIEECRQPDGYILAYPPVVDSLRSEEPNYARAWFTHGLIDAAIAGNPKAYGLLRGHADWFNKWTAIHPKLMYWNHNSHQGHIASTRTYLSPVGQPEDLQVAEKYYVCDWWMSELAARRDSAIFQYPLQNPHCYLITSFEAYLDHYFATGDKVYLNAMQGAWDMIHDNWEHVGGSIAICEKQWFVENGKRVLKHWDGTEAGGYPPHSYFLDEDGHTGEICGSVFWTKFNQRLHRLYPDDEKYVAEIEKTIYNIALASQAANGDIRYHASIQARKDVPGRVNSCCEGQGTRLLGSLPEYIYSIAQDGVYVNLFEPSTIRCEVNAQPVELTLDSRFPLEPEVTLRVAVRAPTALKLRIRVPSWATAKMDILVNGKRAATGKAGAYVVLSRKWSDGDEISFTLPMGFVMTKYSGVTEGFAGKEAYALEYGPLLMALAGTNRDGKIDLPFAAAELTANLKAVEGKPLHFALPADTLEYMPYYEIDRERFTTYPVYAK